MLMIEQIEKSHSSTQPTRIRLRYIFVNKPKKETAGSFRELNKRKYQILNNFSAGIHISGLRAEIQRTRFERKHFESLLDSCKEIRAKN